MKDSNKHNGEFDEVDLVDLKKATASLLDTIGFFIYKGLKYGVSKWKFIGVGLILGLILGYVKYSSHQKMLQTAEFSVAAETAYSIILQPKYESMDYLDQLAQTNFSDKLGYTQITKAELIGLGDVFPFVSKDSSYAKIYEIIASKAETLHDAINTYAVAKNLPYQLLKIETEPGFDINVFTKDLQAHFNQHPYFKERQRIQKKQLVAEKARLEEELLLLTAAVNDAFERRTVKGEDQVQSVVLLNKKREITTRINEIEIEQMDDLQVISIVDYVSNHQILANGSNSIEKQIAKDIIKLVLLFFILAMAIDFVRYYKTKQ